MLFCEEIGHLLQALLAPARSARERQVPRRIEGEQGFHIECRACCGNRCRDASAAVQRIKVVNHESGLHEVARLFGPLDQLFCRKPRIALAQRLKNEQALGRRADHKVDQIERRIGEFLFHLGKQRRRS